MITKSMITMMTLSFLIMKISTIISKKIKMKTMKMSTFECAFNSMKSTRIPFSMRFFLVSIIFLIFDVEIALLLPMIFTFKFSNLIYWSLTSWLFLLILLMGLFHEWNQGALNWF